MAWRPRGCNRPHRRRLGLWAPSGAIEVAEAEAAATTEQRSKLSERGARSRAKQEVVYRDEFEDAINHFLAFVSEHVDLADEISREAATLGCRSGEWTGWAYSDAFAG